MRRKGKGKREEKEEKVFFFRSNHKNTNISNKHNKHTKTNGTQEPTSDLHSNPAELFKKIKNITQKINK